MTSSAKSADELRQLRDRFRDLLEKISRERPQRTSLVKTASEMKPAWEVYELNQMFGAVSRERDGRRLPPVKRSGVEQAMDQASGHVDYANKVALYCAEIALGIERTVY
jgi:hypothetical protein